MKKSTLSFWGLAFILLPFWFFITEVLVETKWYWHFLGWVIITIGMEMLSFAFDD